MVDYSTARLNMVDSQLRVNRVTDEAVLAAFSEVPRELFVPDSKRGFAYLDEDIEVGEGRYLLEPMIFARLLEAARITADDMVLSLASATGYATAILTKLASFVVAVEETESLTSKARELLEKLELSNSVCLTGPLAEGYAKQAPYQVILINGAVEEVPEGLLAQLDEGGRLLTVLAGEDNKVGTATLFLKKDGIVSHRPLFNAFCPKLAAFDKPKVFQF